MARFATRVVHENLGIVGIANGLGLLAASVGFVPPAAATAIDNGSGVLAAMNSLRPLLPKPELVAKRGTVQRHP